ncbi:9662_t:CDS:2 [Funneliformis geosporum]|nr:9662_t:CDS:2 [Funneliformis geosporum]
MDRDFLNITSECMMHHLYDCLIRIPLTTVSRHLENHLLFEYDRDNADPRSTTISSRKLVPLTNKFDASLPLDSALILRVVINIARILITLKGIIPSEVIPIGKRQRLGKSEITFYDDLVVKKVAKLLI